MSVQLLGWIISFALIILILFLILLILRAKKTLNSVDNFVKVTQESLIPLLSELKESIERLNRITRDIENSTKNVHHLSAAVGELGALIDELNNFVKRTGLSFSIKAASLGVGVKTALSTLAKGIIKKTPSKDDLD